MNYLPAPTALYVAALVGCRLPSSAEWMAANAGAAKRGHYRGSAWRAQQQFVVSQKGQPQWPDDGIFWPKNYHPKHLGAAAESYNTSDGSLFFREVDGDGGPPDSTFHNLTGNVAEFVWDDPHKFEQLADHSLQAVSTMLDQESDQLFVIGGSALSAPELPVDSKLPVDLRKSSDLPNAWTGYPDVGMRLAFPAATPPGRLLAQILDSHPYLASGQIRKTGS